ncbi:MAG: succinylglutamate desuccinylase/aspartoacylase family protein [Boseongicola sp.]|nr:succinylglutamate desuccinylase/aspartoacylase family protein [Boseongicola sp.]
MAATRVSASIDLDRPGRHVGEFRLRWSDNSNPLGHHPIPVVSLKGGTGPVALLIGGTHGDEFEGPAAIMRLAQRLEPADLAGQVILVPALNAPAFAEASRVSPLDGANLNRTFPGDPNGGPTAMIADFVETELLPRADAIVDLHSGGKASFFQPCTLVTHCTDRALYEANLALARAFGLPLIWRLGPQNDDRSVNAAAERHGVPMIATELGGGGGTDPGITSLAETGLLRMLRHMGIVAGQAEPQDARIVEIASPDPSLYAPGDGVFDRAAAAGQAAKSGVLAGRLHHVFEPERPSREVNFLSDGFILAHTCRGLVRRGELLHLVARDVT